MLSLQPKATLGNISWHLTPQVHIVREKITWPGARIKKNDEGMPNYENNNVKGDLYITFDVEFPRVGLEENEKEGGLHLAVLINEPIKTFHMLRIKAAFYVLT